MQLSHIFVLDPYLGIKHLQSRKTFLCVLHFVNVITLHMYVYPVHFHAVRETATNGDGSRKDSKDNRHRNVQKSALYSTH